MKFRTPLLAGAVVGMYVFILVPALAKTPRPGWVIPNTAIVRSGPGQSYARVGSLSRGNKVYVLAFRDKWCQITLPSGSKGWVAEWLLEFSASKGRKLAEEKSAGGSQQVTPAWVKVNDANVRGGPGLSYHRYGTLSCGTKVYIIETRGEWHKCRTPGGYGWLRNDLLEFDADAGRALAPSAKGRVEGRGAPSAKGFVAGSDVRLRDRPSTAGNIVAVLTEGQTVYVVGRHGNWYRLRVHGGNAGWVHAELIKLVGEEHSATASATPLAPKPDFPSPTVKPKALYAAGADRHPVRVEAWTAGDDVCVRTAPGLGARLKTKLSSGTKVIVTGVDGHWVYARLPDGGYGWIAGWLLNYVTPQQCHVTDGDGQTYPVRVGWVDRPQVNLRLGPGLEYPEVGELGLGAKFVVLEKSGQWYRIASGNGAVGWVASWLVDTREQRLARQQRLAMIASGQVSEASAFAGLLAGASSLGSKIVNLASAYLGYPYVRGGESPSGFDCSGFVRYVMKRFGIDVSHDSRVLFRQGTPVSRHELQPGDVVFFRNTYRAGISHVGIYIGDDKFIHASTHETGVRISSLNKPYYVDRYVGARRMY
jgi:N-acetylmuramoyl-L-alanine amidase